MKQVTIIGGGPAGASAAIAACRAGAEVSVREKSAFPRHKVCGEFLSPELARALAGLGVWKDCEAAQPSRVVRAYLRIGRRQKAWRLPEPAYGLSRYRLDQLLLEKAKESGATVAREASPAFVPGPNSSVVIAHGRQAISRAGSRQFGFKAHFQGPTDDTIELYFFNGCYVGINAIEGGLTNVCGLGPEHVLRAMAFDIDALMANSDALRERLKPLSRAMEWLKTGPLVYGARFSDLTDQFRYLTGDALGFVDPFTGSGILSAVITGGLAGRAAATGEPVARYLKKCRGVLGHQYLTASLIRAALSSGLAAALLPMVPGRALFHYTRPRVSQN